MNVEGGTQVRVCTDGKDGVCADVVGAAEAPEPGAVGFAALLELPDPFEATGG